MAKNRISTMDEVPHLTIHAYFRVNWIELHDEPYSEEKQETYFSCEHEATIFAAGLGSMGIDNFIEALDLETGDYRRW